MRKCSFFQQSAQQRHSANTPEKDVRHLRPGWRISLPDTEPIIAEDGAHPETARKSSLARCHRHKKRGKASVKTPFPSLSSDMYVLCHFISITRFSAVLVSGRRFGKSTVRTPSATLAPIRSLSTSSGKMKDCWNLE